MGTLSAPILFLTRSNERSQPSVFELLLPPQLRKSLQIARDVGAVAPDDGMDIEQRSIRVKYKGSGLQ
jgi:hypothetical protein